LLAGNSLAGCAVLDLLLEVWPPGDVLVVAPPPGSTAAWHPSLADHARGLGVDVIEPARVNDDSVVDRVVAHDTDLLLSVYYTQIFHPRLLASVDGPALNFHPARLPRHRGTAPLIWAIVEGDAVTGVSVHDLTEGIDTGDLRYLAPLPIHPDDTGHSLHLKAARLVSFLAADIIRRLTDGRGLPDPVEQRGEATYHSLRDPHVNHIDWNWTVRRVRDVVRALAPPLPGAYAELDGRRLTLCSAAVVPVLPALSHPPGVLEVSPVDGRVQVWAADGPIVVGQAVFDGRELTGPQLGEALLAHNGATLQ
jgi:methionyl-tRNA formyltransferase